MDPKESINGVLVDALIAERDRYRAALEFYSKNSPCPECGEIGIHQTECSIGALIA